MKLFKLPYCLECGESRVPHHLEKIPQQIEEWLSRSRALQTLVSAVDRTGDAILSKFSHPDQLFRLARALERVKIVSIDTDVGKHNTTRTHALYEGAAASGVTLYTIRMGATPIGFIGEKVVRGATKRIAFKLIPRPHRFVSPSLSWMDDKGLLKKKLEAAGLPCAEGGAAHTEAEAVALFKRINRPVITKPHRGSRGRHTTLDIRTEGEVRIGFRIASQLSSQVIVEAYLKGTVHRVTLIGMKPVAVARREYPHVVGDGTHTVRELVDIENRNPLRDGFFYRKIDAGPRAPHVLEKQGFTFDSIPTAGLRVIVNDKNSRLHGTMTEDMTDVVHPENIALFERLGALLGDPVVGVDFLISDITRPWTEQRDAGFLECNSMPFIDVHHKVASGRTINVAKYLWEEVFKV